MISDSGAAATPREGAVKRALVFGVLIALGGVAVFSLVIQAVPYGRDHTNPPVGLEPVWDSPQTRELAVRACFDCHSNETVWPWYSNIAPVSWLIQRDVDKGRAKLNYSEWDRPQDEGDESAEELREGDMPPWFYPIPDPKRRLSGLERASLIRGLEATFGTEGNEGGEEHDDDDDDD